MARLANGCDTELGQLLEKCKSSVKTLKVDSVHFPVCRAVWPSDGIFGLPKLEHLELVHSELLAEAFVAFLLQAENLRVLVMDGTSLYPDVSEWRTILDAIRNHPGRMRLILKDIALREGRHYDQHTSQGMDCEPHPEPLYDVERSLSHYLANTGSALHLWFDDLRENEDD